LGRKNAKTTLAACLLLAHLCGPPANSKPNSQLFSAAQSRDQAGIIFSLAAKMVRINPALARIVTIQETAKSLICTELGTRYRALSADATTAYGLSPQLVIHDELGQVRGPRSALYEALETATGAQENPLSIIISTQAPTDADLFSVLIDDALAGHDPHTVVKLYTAPADLDPFNETIIALANPALGTFLNTQEVLAMAAAAKRMPAREAEYRNLILNQRVEPTHAHVRFTGGLESLRRAGRFACGSDALRWSRFIRGRGPYRVGFNRMARWQVACAADILVAIGGVERKGDSRSASV